MSSRGIEGLKHYAENGTLGYLPVGFTGWEDLVVAWRHHWAERRSLIEFNGNPRATS